MVNQARHEQIEQLFHAALALDPGERGDFIRRSCASDPALLTEVQSLISEHELTGSFMAAPAYEIKADLLVGPEGSLEGKSLGHFIIQERIGAGGMGVVHRARDTTLGREVAIKVLSEAIAHDSLRLERFKREARMLASLNHSNIATIHSLEEFDGIRFIVMELLPGETLADRIDRGALSLGEALAILSQTAAALQAAHEKGIIHRDLKPANIQLLPGEIVKVLDFGLAKAADVQAGPTISTIDAAELSRGVIAGTPAYLSPEQVRGEPLDPRVDIWAFGCVAYETLTGRRAFRGNTPLEIASGVLQLEPDWSRLSAPTPNAVRTLIQRCMEKDREHRYASGGELLHDLAACQRRLSSPGLRAILRKPQVAIPVVIMLVAVLAIGGWLVIRSRRQSWARNVALPEIARLLDKADFDGAFRLGREAEAHIPDNPSLLEAKRHYSVQGASVQSTPPGAEVYVKGYLNVDASWLYVGKTPFKDISLPRGYLRWRVTKEEFVPAELAAYSLGPAQFVLHPPENSPSGMVRVAGGVFGFRGFPPAKLEDFWFDKYEVTNKQFKQFIDAGGYQKREYWKHPFVKNGKILSWEDALAEFRDTTGRPGPSTWQLESYPQGREEFPVNGVSWYEAAAYAEFAGKSLPTVYHWLRAHATPQASEILRLSNFSGRGPAQVGAYSGLSPYGNYDMAGNVREWCWNQAEGAPGGRRYIFGASWGQAPYRFPGPDAAQPWDRSETNGFRCAKIGLPLAAGLTASVEPVSRDYTKEKPVSDEIFQVYRSFYSYQRSELKPEVESVDESALHWRKETVSFNAAYGGERVIAHLFLPKNAEPPYQTVIYFASGLARRARSSDELQLELPFVDFLPRIGRAVLYLVYKGTYERHLDRPATADNWNRDLVICWSRDFSRTIDYLETRPDIYHQKLGYYSFSNPIVPVLSAIDGRIKAGVHIGSGFPQMGRPPEYDPLHFAPRAKEPTLLIGGRYDFLSPVETSLMPLLRLLGAPEKDKRLALFDTGHSVYPSPEMIKEVLDWLDRYLGPVKTK